MDMGNLLKSTKIAWRPIGPQLFNKRTSRFQPKRRFWTIAPQGECQTAQRIRGEGPSPESPPKISPYLEFRIFFEKNP
jgi:hypothetical protein